MNLLNSLLRRTRVSGDSPNSLSEMLNQHIPVTLSHHTYIARWHTDCRQPVHFILLHGLYNSGNVLWNDFMRAVNDLPTTGMTPKFPIQMYALDLRDHGRSPHSESIFQLSQACADVMKFIQSPLTEGQKIFLIGHGIGGYIASVLGLAYPSHIAGVASLNASILKVHSKVHPATILSLDTPLASDKERSKLKRIGTSNENLTSFFKECNSFQDVDKKLKILFPNTLERNSFSTSTISSVRCQSSDSVWKWKCNVDGISKFDVQRKSEHIDRILASYKIRNENTPYINIHDASAEFDSDSSIRSLYSKAKIIKWNDFGGHQAETSMVLPQPKKLVKQILQDFDMLEKNE